MNPVTEHVDTWEMVVVHRMFRREFRLLPSLVRNVAPGDTRRSGLVAGHITDLARALDHHHTGEDDLLWPILLERASPDAAVVRRMAAQHTRLAGLLDGVRRLTGDWAAGAGQATRDRLADVIAQASAALDEHLTDEETEILPLVSRHLTQAEWDAVGKHGQQAIPKGAKGFVFLGALLDGTTEAEHIALLRLLPVPVRIAWRLVGPGIHRRAANRLRGTLISL